WVTDVRDDPVVLRGEAHLTAAVGVRETCHLGELRAGHPAAGDDRADEAAPVLLPVDADVVGPVRAARVLAGGLERPPAGLLDGRPHACDPPIVDQER